MFTAEMIVNRIKEVPNTVKNDLASIYKWFKSTLNTLAAISDFLEKNMFGEFSRKTKERSRSLPRSTKFLDLVKKTNQKITSSIKKSCNDRKNESDKRNANDRTVDDINQRKDINTNNHHKYTVSPPIGINTSRKRSAEIGDNSQLSCSCEIKRKRCNLLDRRMQSILATFEESLVLAEDSDENSALEQKISNIVLDDPSTDSAFVTIRRKHPIFKIQRNKTAESSANGSINLPPKRGIPQIRCDVTYKVGRTQKKGQIWEVDLR